MTVRSAVLARTNTVGAQTPAVAVVPPAHAYLIKSVALQNYGLAGSNVSVYIVDSGGTLVGVLYSAALAASAVDFKEVWIVAQAGDTLYCSSSASSVHFWISGADLQ